LSHQPTTINIVADMSKPGRSAPRCIIIARPNGAGKTTFAREFLSKEAGVVHFVNPGLSLLRPELAALGGRRARPTCHCQKWFCLREYSQWDRQRKPGVEETEAPKLPAPESTLKSASSPQLDPCRVFGLISTFENSRNVEVSPQIYLNLEEVFDDQAEEVQIRVYAGSSSADGEFE